jgi:hypothetical protein
MSQKKISANMNPPNILGEPPVQDEDMNPDDQPVEGEETSVSGHSTYGKNNNSGLLLAPTCITCFNKNKYLSTTNGIMSASIALESMFFFSLGMFHRGYYNDKSNTIFIQAQLFCAPTKYSNVL